MPLLPPLKNSAEEQGIYTRQVGRVSVILVVLTITLIFRLAYLQILEHHYYEALSQNNRLEKIPLLPTRGLIFDRNGLLLAKNIPVFTLEIIPNQVKDLEETLHKLRMLIPMEDYLIDQFRHTLKRSNPVDPIALKVKLSDEEMAVFYLHKYQFPGVQVNSRLIREYPLGEAFSTVLGYVGRINEQELETLPSEEYRGTGFIGKLGVEKAFESSLHGHNGYQETEIDATGKLIRQLNRTPPISGDTLYLTLDSQLQMVAYEAMKEEVGAIVAIDPQNGEVLALVSTPGFDPNRFVQGISNEEFKAFQKNGSNPMYNRAISGQYSEGSTIKPFLALKGLDDKIISTTYTIHDPGYFKLPNNDHLYRDWDPRGHGQVNYETAIIVSCDTFFYDLAVKTGMRRMADMLRQFGFGQKTGIELEEESSGLLPSPEWKKAVKKTPWYTGDTILAGIGQGFMLATPLQMASAIGTLSTQGKRYQPTLLLKTEKANQKVIRNPKKLIHTIVLNNTNDWGLIIRAMEGVISSVEPWGTGFRFGRDAPYRVAAKTGTVQIYRPKEGKIVPQAQLQKSLRDNALFTAFAPLPHPTIAIAVVIEHTSGLIAAQVARKVMDTYLLRVSKGKTHVSE